MDLAEHEKEGGDPVMMIQTCWNMHMLGTIARHRFLKGVYLFDFLDKVVGSGF